MGIREEWRSLHPGQIEAIGICLIVVAALWEVTILREASGAAARAPFVDLNEKLKLIWLAMGDQSPRDFVAKHTDSFFNAWSAIEHAKDDVWKVGPLTVVRSMLFVAGSALTIYGKWRAGEKK